MKPADFIWNRACRPSESTEISEREGDRSLAAMLLVHGLVMNGGPWGAIESCDGDELSAAAAGYRYFGLETGADLIDRLAAALIDVPVDDGKFEAEWNDAYSGAVSGDDVLVVAFEARHRDVPEDFAPRDG
ncbi:MAG: hypothetical protein GY925_03860 [Actinomycetia bacterium]|nr:hypothetical protein [Actinomycetes bacterium]